MLPKFRYQMVPINRKCADFSDHTFMFCGRIIVLMCYFFDLISELKCESLNLTTFFSIILQISNTRHYKKYPITQCNFSCSLEKL